MRNEEAMQGIQREMNRRRRHGGAEDVSPFLWENSIVSAAIQKAAECAFAGGFKGNWDYASPELEEKMDALAGILRSVSNKQNAYQPGINASGSSMWRSKVVSQLGNPGSEYSEAEGTSNHFPFFPSVVRQDVGGRALAEYLTWHWQNHGWSAFICKQVCGGEYLSREEARVFLTSGLPKVLGYDDYERLGLCPARTTGRILSKYLKVDGLLFTTNMVMIDPKTRLVTATTDTLFSKTGHYCVEVNMPQDHTNMRKLKRLVLNLNEDRYHYITSRSSLPGSYEVEFAHGRDFYIAPHPAPYFDGQDRYVEGYSTSVMADLIGTAQMFCGQYMVSIWDMLEACLTGQFPPQPSVTISSSKCTIIDDDAPDELSSGKVHTGFIAQGPATITVQPWVTPECLADTWREYRKNNPSYSPSEKQADALHFVISHTTPGAAFEWDKLARQWQSERGELMTRGKLHKQFQRARAAILPEYCDLQRE